jgi:flavin-dependent dehydrogenase
MYDVIVVGARAAGAATAMLLARAGVRVLVVDRATFPSDTCSTHQVQVPGIARLRRWGLLDEVAATTPAVRRVRLDAGRTVVDGRYPPHDGADALYSPRRTTLDALLVAAARAAGAEVRERFGVEALVRDGAGAVTGITGRARDTTARTSVTETARLVVGADGKRSFVAAAVGAAAYHTQPAKTFASYTYWAGVPGAATEPGEIIVRPGLTVPVFPTADGLLMVAMFAPLHGFERFRRDVEAGYLAAMARCGDLAERLRAGTRAEHFRTAPDVPNGFRVPHGPGWALVGDAGLTMDPVGAQGISNAFRDAELLASAVLRGLDRGGDLSRELAGYQRSRDEAALPAYEFVRGLADLRLAPLQRLLLTVLARRPDEADRFFGVLAGSQRPDTYFRPANLLGVALGGLRRRGLPVPA